MAIRVQGPEEPTSGKDILRETLVSYNHISNCGGVNIDASFSLFTTISHNYITKTRGRYAISVGGWRNLEEAIESCGFTPLPIRVNHAMGVRDLPLHHRDPFDRMLIAQAVCEDLVLVTVDEQIRSYDVSILWAYD